MATVTKRLCLPVGQYQPNGADKPKTEFREIGVMVEFEDQSGNKWSEVKLNLDILNPTLFQLAKSQVDKGQASARVKLFDVTRKVKDKSANSESDGAEDDDLPY